MNQTKSLNITAIIICLVAFSLSILVGYHHKIGNFGVETDFYGAYISQAQKIADGEPYTYTHNPPGYMVVLALVTSITKDPFVAAKLIGSTVFLLLGLTCYFLLCALFSPLVSLCTTIFVLIALFPFSFLAAMDIFGVVAMLIPLLAFFSRPDRGLKTCILAGFLAAMAYWVRYSTIFVPIGIVAAILFVDYPALTIRKKIQQIGAFLLTFIVFILPWLYYNTRQNGSPMFSTAYLQVASHFFHPAGDVFVMREAFDFSSLVDVLLFSPLHLIKRYLKDVAFSTPPKLFAACFVFPVQLISGAGFLYIIRNYNLRRYSFFFIFFLGYLLLGLVGFYARYYYFLYPILFLSVAYFLFNEESSKSLGKIPVIGISNSWLIFIVLCLFMTNNSIKKTTRELTMNPTHVLEIAEILKTRSQGEGAIFALKPHYAYYSGLKKVFPVDQTPENLFESAEYYVAKAREANARYLVYSRYEVSRWPGLVALSDPNAMPDSVELIYRHEPSDTLVYEIIYKK